MALTSDPCMDKSDGSSGSERPTTPFTTKCCSPLPALSTVPVFPVVASYEGMHCNPRYQHVRAPPLLSGLEPSRTGYSSEDCPAFQVTSFHVAFHNLKCPYHQWAATLLEFHVLRPFTGQHKLMTSFIWTSLKERLLRYWTEGIFLVFVNDWLLPDLVLSGSII